MKNPHWTPAQEAEIERAELLSTKATIYELGVAEFLKTHMACLPEVEAAQVVLAEAIDLRKKGYAIHDSLHMLPIRKRGAIGAAKFGKKTA
jgi:hypothetical protein